MLGARRESRNKEQKIQKEGILTIASTNQTLESELPKGLSVIQGDEWMQGHDGRYQYSGRWVNHCQSIHSERAGIFKHFLDGSSLMLWFSTSVLQQANHCAAVGLLGVVNPLIGTMEWLVRMECRTDKMTNFNFFVTDKMMNQVHASL